MDWRSVKFSNVVFFLTFLTLLKYYIIISTIVSLFLLLIKIRLDRLLARAI